MSSMLTPILATFCILSNALGEPPTFTTTDIRGISNVSHANCCCPGFTNGELYPLGLRTYFGVPFQHGTVEKYAFTGIAIYCTNGGVQQTFSKQVSVPGNSIIHILLSAWNGHCGVDTRFVLIADFSDGTSKQWSLQNGTDFRGDNASCGTTGANTVEVWSSGRGQHLDMLSISVGQLGKTISAIKVRNESANDLDVGPFVFGLTMETPYVCLGDLDNDSTVGGADIGLLLSNWGPCGSACLHDLNNDGKVNGGDLGLLLAGWGPCPE
jgi:hypothetical protein